ncbi:MAG: glycosyl transferase family 28 [Muribaculaceae bacterium]|nr:glycosyl transferase family 28 [Muribaculaceae bacterium]
MIFVTMGTQIPFDRFLRMLDEIAPLMNGEEIVAQTITDKYVPRNFKPTGFIAPDDFNSYVNRARIIVSHAGMGSIISALEAGKPIVVVPRIAALGEHRNEHQLATADALEKLGYIHVARNTEQLRELLCNGTTGTLRQINKYAPPEFVNAILAKINKD